MHIQMWIEASEFVRAASLLDFSEDRGSMGKNSDDEALPGKELNECRSSSSATSSIGRNSDDLSSERSLEVEDSGENEVESAYNGPLDRMDALEEVLPMRRGISQFYNGKSKSFATLAEASSASIKEIVKAENAYTRKRRNSMAFNHVWDRNRSFPLSGGISKRPISSSRSTLAFAVAIHYSESSSNMRDDSNPSPTCRSPILRPPLHPHIRVVSHCGPVSSPSQQSFSAWRSMSLFDLQHCTDVTAPKLSCSAFGEEGSRA